MTTWILVLMLFSSKGAGYSNGAGITAIDYGTDRAACEQAKMIYMNGDSAKAHEVRDAMCIPGPRKSIIK